MIRKKQEDKSVERAKKHLGRAIVKCRGDQWSQRQLALAIGLPPSNLKYIEDGVNASTAEVYARLMDTLNPPADMRDRMDRLYMTIRKAPPPDVCSIIGANPGLIDIFRALDGKQITKVQLEQMNSLITSFADACIEEEETAAIHHGESDNMEEEK